MSRIIQLDKLKECEDWGKQGEHNATTLVVDISDFLAFQEGQPLVFFQRKDGHPYIHNFVKDGENLFISLSSADTQIIGKCELQINWVGKNNTVKKKKTYTSFILPNKLEEDLPLTQESVMALDNLKGYVEEAKSLLVNIEKASKDVYLIDSNSLPPYGEEEKIYITKDQKIYFWSSETYSFVELAISNNFEYIYGGDAFGH